MDAVIEQLTLHDSFPLASLCETLEVSRAGYYAWRSEAQSSQERVRSARQRKKWTKIGELRCFGGGSWRIDL
jgi:hypothetical protein